jgi:hypothetical protein
MKFAYADPPYLHMGGKYTEYHDEALIWNDPEAHINLINRLVDEYPDGWAVSLSVPSLQLYLANSPTDVRVAAWTKTFHQIRVNVAIQYAWEPIIWRGGRKQTPVKPMVRDWHSGRIAMKKGLFGAKPKDFNHYILDLLQWQIGDQLIDLFEGTKGMQKAIEERFKNDL